ncbi:Uncharacterised protein [Salmonella enterica subsp. enterica serovar Sanjuan]|uniref:Uncharacterized protein n=1 Tax=Salmonella enterica subsp. enterica serovar Sanjuan TaxID=1160765 RepID=A0A3S4ESL9_SALET|nr:Uncharacterised protein [Salmonella enterica subsp. enterica serovar Sanjuan]
MSWATSVNPALRQCFNDFQTVAVFIDDFLGELDVFDDVTLRHIFRTVGIGRGFNFFIGNAAVVPFRQTRPAARGRLCYGWR